MYKCLAISVEEKHVTLSHKTSLSLQLETETEIDVGGQFYFFTELQSLDLKLSSNYDILF